MAFPTSFAQNPEFYWAPPETRRRGTDYFPLFAAALALSLLAIAFVAPTPVAANGAPFQVFGP